MRFVEHNLETIDIEKLELKEPNVLLGDSTGGFGDDHWSKCGYAKIAHIEISTKEYGVTFEAFENFNGSQESDAFTFIMEVDFGSNCYFFCTDNSLTFMRFSAEIEKCGRAIFTETDDSTE